MSKEFEEKVLEFIEISKNNFNKLENKIDTLETRIDAIDGRLDTVDKRLDAVDKRLDAVDKRLDTVDKRIDAIDERLDTLSSSVVLIEHQVITEFPALFEAFELHQEMHKDYEEKNSYLSAKVEEDSMRISVLEDQMKFIKKSASK